MIVTSIFVASMITVGFLFYVLGELRFLAPYRALIWHQYAPYILWFIAVFFFNLVGIVYIVHRHFALKDTGRKLQHVEKQLRTGSSISEELTARLSAE
jgi:hypothetical protein